MTVAPARTDTISQSWIGCLACYDEGRLVGDWFDAVAVDEVTTYDIHGAHADTDRKEPE